MPARFTNISNEKVREICLDVYSSYPGLGDVHVIFRRSRIKGLTMRAMPRIRTLFPTGEKRTYIVQIAQYVRDSRQVEVDELDEEILRGWIAHELGHVMDYRSRSLFGMVMYGMKYWLDKGFARHVEHEADRIAVRHGFLDELIATKRFLFESPDISVGYRTRLESLYMSIEEVKLCVPEEQRIL